jgi:phospholipase/carboxylesterase
VRAAVISLVLSACAAPPPPEPSLAWVAWTSVGGVVEKDKALDDVMPTVIAMHGLGDNPRHFIELFHGFDGVRVIAPAGPIARDDGGHSWFAHMATSEPDAIARELPERADDVDGLIRWLHAHEKVAGKPAVVGFSQGAMMSFEIALTHADHIAGAVPIAGFLPTQAIPTSAPSATAPVRAIHGDADRRLAFSEGERTVADLKKLGFDATMDRFPGVGHSIPPEVRERAFGHLRDLLALPDRR